MTRTSEKLPEDIEKFVEEMLLSAPVDNVLWKTCEYLAFKDEPVEEPMLDLGCGDGKFARLLFKQTPTVGLDIKLGRVRKAADNQRYRFVLQGDACHLPFRDEAFSTVFSACALEHIPDIEQVLGEVSRVLRPRGKFLFSVPSHLFPRYLFFPVLFERMGIRGAGKFHVRTVNHLLRMHHFYSPSRWRRMLARAGLRLRRIRYIMPAKAMAFWDHSFLWGNVLFQMVRVFYITPLRPVLTQRFARLLLPFLRRSRPRSGGGLVLVAEKED